jgi:hypothetical protein
MGNFSFMAIELKAVKLVESFKIDIDKIKTDKKVGTLDAILIYCSTNNIEIENVASLIKGNPAMKADLAEEAEGLNFLPKTNRISI